MSEEDNVISLTKWMTFIVPWRFLRQQRRNSVYRYIDEDPESGCRIYTLPTSLRPLAGRSNRIYIPGICSIYYGQVSTRHCQAHWHRFYCHALYERSLATDPASTADWVPCREFASSQLCIFIQYFWL